MRVLLIGKSSGRLDCLAESLRRSRRIELFILTNLSNPSLEAKGIVEIGPTENPDFVERYARDRMFQNGTIAVISNEEPLAAGVVDRLVAIGVPVVGPTKDLARIETSKHFCRSLMAEHKVGCNPLYGFCENGDLKRAESHMHGFLRYVVKPDGLTGGKGVRVQGEHFKTHAEALAYCREIFEAGGDLLIEEKLTGPEFSLMSFSDGKTVVDMPAVQDHKRLLNGDLGPNTGGMGSYTPLPWLTQHDIANASYFNRKALLALQQHTGQPYRGIIYGNYILCRKGIRLIEFNARFGDPEVMNVLPLLETDFGDICDGIANGRLNKVSVRFSERATVCKYLLPQGYPEAPTVGRVGLDRVEAHPGLRLYHGALRGDMMTGSRALAVVGIADSVMEAEKIAETAARQVKGPVYHRTDIGTAALIGEREKLADLIRTYP